MPVKTNLLGNDIMSSKSQLRLDVTVFYGR